MKFAATVTLLGCAGAALAALQFKPLDNRSTLPLTPEIRQPFMGGAPTAGRNPLDFLPKAPQNVFPKVEMPREELMKMIQAAALRHNVPPAFVKSIVAAESNFDPNAVSPKGAIGPMQLMPETAEQYGADPTVPAENIDAGTHYLRVLMDRYHHCRSSLQRVIAAYNAGPTVVDRYRGIPPFRETREYVARVLSFMRQFGGRA